MSDNCARKRILVVDDDLLMRTMASSTLRHVGHEVVEVDNGLAALEAFEQGVFDLLLLDVVMPGIDGYEVCARIRRHPAGQHMPILMLTGLDDTDAIGLAYGAGATDFISKPINWALLSYRVRYALRAGEAIDAERRSRENLERAQRMANMGNWEMRTQDGALTCSPELVALLRGKSDPIAPANAEAFLQIVVEADRARVRAAREAALEKGIAYQLSFELLRADGTARSVYEQAAPTMDGAGRQAGVVGIVQDVTDRLEAESRISRLAHYDSLTGLANRAFFGLLGAPVLERAARAGGECALLHIDMDRFKSVNDALSHSGGDDVLRVLAKRVQSTTRASDTAAVGNTSSESVVARVGANAFTLLLSDVHGDRGAAKVAQRILDLISRPIQVGERSFVLTASVGIAMFPRDARDLDGLVRCAEQAVYAAKGGGRKQYRFFDEAMHAAAREQLDRESDLRRAIAVGQLRLHYQPKFDAASGQVCGAEALVRWLHPERGLVPPGDFIPLAESTGLILPLTSWVLQTVCADLMRRRLAGLPEWPVAVNLAAASFGHDDLLNELDSLLLRYGLEAGCLTLEVTESMLMQDVEEAVRRLRELHDRGFALSLDDFGTGYSSLSYLKRFPIDELKIDRSFVADVTRGGRDASLTASIIALAQGLGLSVVAEGVETDDQQRFLTAHGCTKLQGFLLGRPMPGEAFDALLRAQRDGPQIDSPAPDAGRAVPGTPYMPA